MYETHKPNAAVPQNVVQQRKNAFRKFKDFASKARRQIAGTRWRIAAPLMSLPIAGELLESAFARQMPFSGSGGIQRVIAETAALAAVGVIISRLVRRVESQRMKIDSQSRRIDSQSRRLDNETNMLMKDIDTIREEKSYISVILESSPSSIIVFGADGKIKDYNAAAIIAHGFTSKEPTGSAFLDLISPHDREAVSKAVVSVLGSAGSADMRCRMLTKDGVSYGAELILRLVRHAGGEPDFIVATVRDMTEADALASAQKMECVALLASGVAHDFNNLMMIIGGSAQMLELLNKEGIGSEASRITSADENISTITNAVRTGSELTRRFLDFAKGKGQKIERVDVNRVVDDIRALLKSKFADTGVEFSISPCEKCAIMADSAQVYQLILNLCINAEEAIAGKNGKISVSTSLEGGRATIRVSDNGCGMDENTRLRIFEPYFTTKAGSENRKGHGLGLSIVYRVVNDFKGAIAVESEKGKGTTFTVSFPAA